MPALPTLDLSQEHFDRVVAAFPGDTAAAKADAYRRWLTSHLIDHVESVEAQRIQQAQAVELAERLRLLRASLPPRPVEVVRDLTPPPIVQPPA